MTTYITTRRRNGRGERRQMSAHSTLGAAIDAANALRLRLGEAIDVVAWFVDQAEPPCIAACVLRDGEVRQSAHQ